MKTNHIRKRKRKWNCTTRTSCCEDTGGIPSGPLHLYWSWLVAYTWTGGTSQKGLGTGDWGTHLQHPTPPNGTLEQTLGYPLGKNLGPETWIRPPVNRQTPVKHTLDADGNKVRNWKPYCNVTRHIWVFLQLALNNIDSEDSTELQGNKKIQNVTPTGKWTQTPLTSLTFKSCMLPLT